MPDVFISYRRGDALAANWFAGVLEEQFSVFLDNDRKSIRPGDRFADRIEAALNDCRVVLVLIGSKWAEKKNVERLASEKDWVRHEILSGLKAAPAVKVIPVLIDGASFPNEEKLPAEVRPLAALHRMEFDANRSKADFGELLSTVKEWLTQRQDPLSRRTATSEELFCLCDRVEQEEALIELVSASQPGSRAYVAVVHGHQSEYHESVLNRLRYKGSLEGLLQAKETGYATCVVQWNREAGRAGKYLQILRNGLKSEFLHQPIAPDAVLFEFLARRAQPLIAIVQVTWSDLESCGPGLVQGLADAWRTLFTTTLSTHLPKEPLSSMAALLWVNLSYENDTQRLADVAPPILLPPLDSVKPGHVQEWLALPEVKRVAVGHEGELLALHDDDRYCWEKGKIRMLRFMEAVRSIIR